MKKCILVIACLLALPIQSWAATWHTVSIKNVYVVADSSYATSDLPGIRVMVEGTFSPALPCGSQSFALFPTDDLYKEMYAMLMSAQLSGTAIQYLNIYCTATTHVGRGNQYKLGTP